MKFIIPLMLSCCSLLAQFQVSPTGVQNDTPPIIELTFRATLSGLPTDLTLNNVLILESNFAPDIIDFVKDGSDYKISWIPNYAQTDINQNYSIDLVVFNDEYSEKLRVEYGFLNSPSIAFAETRTPLAIRKLDFGQLSQIKQSNVVIRRGRTIGFDDQKVFVNEFSLQNDNFRFFLQGKVGPDNGEEPPFETTVGDRYTVDFFIDSSNTTAPFFDIFTVTYDNGAKAYLPIYARPITVPKNINLNLIAPNGGEVFAVCEDVLVEWEGNIPGIPVDVYLTSFNRADSLLGSSSSNTFLFKAPQRQDSTYKIRIVQSFNIQTTREVDTEDGYVPIKVDFSSNGEELLSTNSTGRLLRVSTADNQIFSTESITPPDGRNIAELKSYKDGVIVHYKGNSNNDLIRYYKFDPFREEYNIDIGISSKKVIVDEDSETLAIIPEYGNRIDFYNATNGNFIRSLRLNGTLASYDINFDEGLLSYIDYMSNLVVIDFISEEILNEFSLRGLPYINNLEISPNGRIIGLAAKRFQLDGSQAEVLVFDRESNSIITTIDAASSDPVSLSFSPSSNYLAIASPTVNKIIIYDLTEGTSSFWSGLTGVINDVSFAENQPILGIAASGAERNPLQYVTFSYPEVDASDFEFSIEEPTAEIEEIIITDEYLFNSSTYLIQDVICNTSDLPIFIEDAYFYEGVNFSHNIQLPDTLLAGECLDIEIEVNPQEIGELEEFLELVTCYEKYTTLIKGIGLPRSLSQAENPIELGQVCVGDTLRTNIVLFTNSDPVPILINRVTFDRDDRFIISELTFDEDVLLNPGETYSIEIVVNPDELGPNNFSLQVEYFNQEVYKADINLSVTGIGTVFDLSHTALPFIKEDPTRQLTITNPGNFEINLIDITANPADQFAIDYNFPVILEPGESITIDITWDLTEIGNANLVFEADPCPVQRFIPLAQWEGSIILFTDEIIADDPSAETEVPIYFSLSTNYDYNGDLDLSGEFRLNPRLYFPIDVISKFESEFENIGIDREVDKRVISFSSRGNFADRDTLMKIQGVAGLAETDFTEIIFSNIQFPEEIDTQNGDGTLTIDSLCGTRRLVHSGVNIELSNVYPNPVDDIVSIEFTSEEPSEVNFGLYTMEGNLIEEKTRDTYSGDNQIEFDLRNLSAGSYYILVKGKNESFTINISKN